MFKKRCLWIIGLVLLVGIGFGGYYIYDSHSKAVAIAAKKEKFNHAQNDFHKNINSLLIDLKGINQDVVTTWGDAEDNDSVVVDGKRIDTSTSFENAVDSQINYEEKKIAKKFNKTVKKLSNDLKIEAKNKTSKDDEKTIKRDKKVANNLLSYSRSLFDPVGTIDEFDAASMNDQRKVQSEIDDLA